MNLDVCKQLSIAFGTRKYDNYVIQRYICTGLGVHKYGVLYSGILVYAFLICCLHVFIEFGL